MPDSDELVALQSKKLLQEIHKLDIETKLLNRRWFCQPQYLATLLPILAVVATGWITYSNSEFKREARESREAVAKLKPEADNLRQQVTALQSEKVSLASERDRLSRDVNILQTKATALQHQILSLNDSVSVWRTQLVDINTRLKSVTPSVVGSGAVFPPPGAEPERKRLQGIIDSMLTIVGNIGKK